MTNIEQRIANELNIPLAKTQATISLLDEGATVPFIARYRKEITGSLDDTQLRYLEERLAYLRELEERRSVIINSINEQQKMTPELRIAIDHADTKMTLEDLYLPFKPKRRTKGQIAIEAGLQALADKLLGEPSLDPNTSAEAFLNPDANIHTIKDALDGAKYILMEHFSEAATLVGQLRHFLMAEGSIHSLLIDGKAEAGQKFADYFEHKEPISKIASHRALALFRGRNEGILSLSIGLINEHASTHHPCEDMISNYWQITHQGRPADQWLAEVVRWCWRVKLLPRLETDLFGQLRERAEADAIKVFTDNLKDLLLAAPAGQKATIGLDPGLRTGVKVAVIDATGKVVGHETIFPTAPHCKTQEAEATLVHLCKKHKVELIAIGNGTASRETERFVKTVLSHHPSIHAKSVVVNEAGASIYSASEFAAKEFPSLDVTIRGAISIARRLQDPLAELVKIEPKAIGVGQYQHDVSQTQLGQSLDKTVEDCVNTVGVEINTASAPLLARVSGLNQTIANNIVTFRDQHGAFRHREQLKGVPRLGDKTYEQAVGFLRIRHADNPLDGSAVHPESYSIVERICASSQCSINKLLNDTRILKSLNPADFTTATIGLPTIKDIFAELEKPGRDPRPEFKTANFKEGVEKLNDLNPNMILEGTVTNVTNFGAFVDVGVHQDGLVHISALAKQFVKDPRTVVKAGDIVQVKVLSVDIPRRRIALSMRLDDEADDTQTPHKTHHTEPRRSKAPVKMRKRGSMGDLLQAALKKH